MEEFDNEAGGTYVYPINYPMRDYQFEIVKAALFKNTLVCLPTGLGKTFIGAVLMYNFYRWYPAGKVIFMAPTKPLVAQQIEACHKVMGIPQEHTAEMTGLKSPEVRTKLWKTQRVFFLTPQVLMNDLSRDACPDKSIKLLVVDEAHRALGQHSYCQVIKLLQQLNCTFRVLALSATPGPDLKAVTQVIANLCIAHIELRNEDSPGILKYVHKRSIEKIVIPIEGELKNIMEKFYEILRPHVSKLIDKRLVYTKDEKTFTQYQVLLAREAFRKNPPGNISHREKGIYEGIFAVCATLYHANELLIMHGIKSFYNFLRESEKKSTNYVLKAEFKNNSNLHKLLEYINELFYSPTCKSNSEMENFMSSKRIPASHPKIDKLCEILLKHFKEFNKNKESTRVMIFSQYRDSVQEITRILEQIDPVIRPISFIGQSSGQFKGLTQKEQLKVVKGFREGYYNTLVATCVGEEGLDIGEVDLIVCYDAPKSAIRLVQRMGRTGRKREGNIIVLVTTGKEEKDYNESQYKRRSLVNTLTKGVKLKHLLYSNNPRMIPNDINPVCLKLHMKVKDWEAPNCKQKIMKKGKRSINAYFQNIDNDKYKTAENFMNTLELKKYETNFKVEDKSLIKKILKPRFHGTTDAPSDESICKDEIDFCMYQPWYTTLQPCFIISHSKQSKHLVELTDFISVQEALGDNNSYEDELAPFMDYSFFKKVTEINKLESYNRENSVKKNVLIKEKRNLKKLSKKGLSSIHTVKNSQSPKLAFEKSNFSQDRTLMNLKKQDLKKISNEEINLDFSNCHEDINVNNSILLLENSVDSIKQNSCLLEIYRNDQKENKLHVMDGAFDFSPTNEVNNHKKVINFPADFRMTGKLFTSISLSPYIKQINDISDYFLFEEQSVKNIKFSIFETSLSAQNLIKNCYEEPVSSMIEAGFLESRVQPHVDVSTKQKLLSSEKRSDNNTRTFDNKLDFNSSFDHINSEKETAHLTQKINYDLGTSSILLTPPESKKESPFNSNCTFNLDSPIFLTKQELPIKCPSVYTSTPRPISKDGSSRSPIKLANVTPILARSKVLCDSNGITNKIISTSKLVIKNDLTIENPDIYQNLDSDSFLFLSNMDDLFAEIDLKSLVQSNIEENASCFDHKMLKSNDVTNLKSTSKLSPDEKKRENSYKLKLNIFRREQNNKDVNPHNPNELLSVTQVIDIVDKSSIHDTPCDNALSKKDVNSKLSSHFHLNPLNKIKPKIVKNLSGQFKKSATGFVTKELSETLSQNSSKPNALSKSPDAERKRCKDDWISCNKFDIVGSTWGVKALSGKKCNLLKCNEAKEDASVQFNISLDLSSDSDEITELANHENKNISSTPQNFVNSWSSNNEKRGNDVNSNYKSRILNRDSLNANNSDISKPYPSMICSKEDKFSSDDEIFDNLDVLALEKNLNDPDLLEEFTNKLSVNLNRSNTAISRLYETTLINLENKSNINQSKLSLSANNNDLSTGGLVNVLSHVQSVKKPGDVLPSVTFSSCSKNVTINSTGSIQKKTSFSELDSPLVIKKKKKGNVLNSSAETSHLHDSTSNSFTKSSDGSVGNLISTTSSNDDFVDSSVYHPIEKENRKKMKKCSKRKTNPSYCGLLHLEAEESGDSVEVSDDENESQLDGYEQSFVDDETQAVEQNIDMRAVYLQSVKSPLKKSIKFASKKASFAQDIFSQPQSGFTSEESEEDSFVVANDFVEYDSVHSENTENLEDSILNQVFRASIETAKEESKKRKSNKRKRILSNISSEDEDLYPAKIKFGKIDHITCSTDKAALKASDEIIVPKNKKESECILYDTNNIRKKADIHEGNDDGLDFQLLTSDDEEDWLEIPLKDDCRDNLKKSTVDHAFNPINHVETDIKNPSSKSSIQPSCNLSPKFASKHLSQTNSNFRTHLPKNSDVVKSLIPVASGSTVISLSNYLILNDNVSAMTSRNSNVNSRMQCPNEEPNKPGHINLKDSSSCKNKFMASTNLSLSFKDTISTQSQVLNSQQFTDAEVCILVDTFEIGIAGLISSVLRSNYNLQTYIVQVTPASYVLSSRMAVYRLSNTAFASIANKTKLITRIRNLLSMYCRPVLIVEKDRKSGIKPIARTTYLDSISCAFVQLPQLKVIYTEDQKSTAETIWHLMKLEKLKGYCIPKFSPGGLHFEQAVKFYRSGPQMTCSCAIFLALNYPTIREAVNSDLKELMKNGKMTAEIATAFRSHFTRAFRKDMLPMSYQLEST